MDPPNWDKSMSYEELMKMTADMQKRTWDQIAQRRAEAARARTNLYVGEGISEQTDWMARQVKDNPHSGKRIGDVLDQMEGEHKRAEQEKFNAADHARKQERLAARMTNTPQRNVMDSYQPTPFNRDAAMKNLVQRYPWLSPTHHDNPDMAWFRKVSDHTNAQIEALNSGDMNAPANYRVGQYPHRS
jgi:hypothetical protein